MHKIVKAKTEHAKLLSELSKKSFLVPHGHSAPKEDIDNYVGQNFSEVALLNDLQDEKNEYYLIYYKNQVAGYSKIIYNESSELITDKNVTYMSRLYLLKDFYGFGLGKELMNFNQSLSKQNNQAGIWLAVWIENSRAISFYEKIGFKKVGDYDFKISEIHSNPNHILYLEF